ncbi:MAG: glucosyltransferase [Cycloclasticus sp. symbiont of Poecilosclerida sp. N]|nr:MAG: glucosyltransferase [Cycloclasticus sp. symbiont of Poecilosclerida sp. N]
MRLAFALYKYFPYGGLARDFVRIANICLEKGYLIDVYVMEWQGDCIHGFNTHILSCKGWSNHGKVADFHNQLHEKLSAKKYDVVIGFNKIPNIDVYYAADSCYIDRFKEKSFFQTFNPRFRFYSSVERAVFGADSKTLCLMISDVQTGLFKQHYGIAEERLVCLPPGIDLSRRRPENAAEIRAKFRKARQFNEQDIVILMVGTGFKTKGVDRAIEALSSLPDVLLSKTHLMVVGEGNLPPYERLAAERKVADKVHLVGGRNDVPAFLLGCDVLLHPARKENTGTVILEAMVAGLPVLVTGVCGYAKHVRKSQAGVVLNAPFLQEALNEQLAAMLASDKDNWAKNALDYASQENLYSMPEKAVEAIECAAASLKNVV